MKKTGGIVVTILTSLLCGLPGLILSCIGLLGLLGTQLPNASPQTNEAFQNTLLGGAIAIGGGIILILIPIVVGFISLRKRRGPISKAPAYTAIPAQPQYPQSPQPARPAYTAPPPQPVQYSTPPADAAPTVSPSQDLYTRLLALNRPTAPFRIVDGRTEGVDLIAEWKIVDAQWYEVFAKANLTKIFRIFLKFDPVNRDVRAMDHEYTVQWRGGIPSIGAQASFFKGQKSSVSFGIGTGFTEKLAPGVVYKYKFNTNELKQPIQQVIASSGWKYTGVPFGKL